MFFCGGGQSHLGERPPAFLKQKARFFTHTFEVLNEDEFDFHLKQRRFNFVTRAKFNAEDVGSFDFFYFCE